jgi:hypothetical protein
LLGEGELEAVTAQSTRVDNRQLTPDRAGVATFHAGERIPLALDELIEHVPGMPSKTVVFCLCSLRENDAWIEA